MLTHGEAELLRAVSGAAYGTTVRFCSETLSRVMDSRYLGVSLTPAGWAALAEYGSPEAAARRRIARGMAASGRAALSATREPRT